MSKGFFSAGLSLSRSHGGSAQSSTGGAGALCIHAGLNGGRVAEEVPRVCGPEIKRPSANEVNGARGEGGGFPGTAGNDPRYSRRVRDAVGQR